MKYLPSFKLWYSEAPDLPCHELVAREHFHLSFDSLERLFWTSPSPRLLDLLRIAMSVYTVDRLARRKLQSQRRRWFRSVRLTVAVSEPEFWGRSDVFDTLIECVEFLSGDNWELQFVKDKPDASRQTTLFLRGDCPFSVPPLLCLYSGGLDSAAGLGIRLAENPGRPVIPITVWHQPHQREVIRRQFAILKEQYNAEVHPLIVKAAIVWSSTLASQRRKQERSQRCRSFLFAAVGAVAAAISEVPTIEVFESGIGAINLPLMAGMIGSKATRGSHPHFLRLMSHLASLTAEREVSFCLPFGTRTKGEVVKELAEKGIKGVGLSTVSCVHYPLHDRVHKQCGVCPACIFRRQALMVAGIREPQDTYKYDLFGQGYESKGIDESHLTYLKAFLLQVANLGPLEPGVHVPPRVQRHLLGTNVVSPGESITPFLDLLSRYRDEWLGLAAHGMVDHEWAWVSLVAPIGAALIGRENYASA
jgi:7-cyano-7-deazaguanine synthase in queuosine biosynthesis